MKNYLTIILAIFACFALTQCAADMSVESGIKKGMTKEQVVQKLGKPTARKTGSQGEVWTYSGERWKRMIPYAGGFVNVKTYKVVFNNSNRVTDYSVTDRGDAMSDVDGVGGNW